MVIRIQTHRSVNSQSMTKPDTNIYKAGDILSIKLFRRDDGSERMYVDSSDGYTDMVVPSAVPTFREYMELLKHSETNPSIRETLEHLKTIYGLIK
jgi:hypothetical protein